MAEIGIDPSWEYGQFKSSDEGTEMWLHHRENSWMQGHRNGKLQRAAA